MHLWIDESGVRFGGQVERTTFFSVREWETICLIAASWTTIAHRIDLLSIVSPFYLHILSVIELLGWHIVSVTLIWVLLCNLRQSYIVSLVRSLSQIRCESLEHLLFWVLRINWLSWRRSDRIFDDFLFNFLPRFLFRFFRRLLRLFQLLLPSPHDRACAEFLNNFFIIVIILGLR